MPNTACAVGAGLTPYDANALLTKPAGRLPGGHGRLRAAGGAAGAPDRRGQRRGRLRRCLVSLFLEGLADGAVTCGLPRDKPNSFAAQMVLGTARLALESGQALRGHEKDAVCSPGGTTIAGVRALESGALPLGAAMNAVIAAYEKTLALKSWTRPKRSKRMV